MAGLVRKLAELDRRWIFLLMGIAVMVPIIFKTEFPETPTALVQVVFDRVDNLPSGSRILLPFDYDPGSAPELQPMATAFTWHCAKKGHKLYYMALWPVGQQMIDDTVDQVLKRDYPDYEYGVDYINLGFKPGYEGVIKVVASNFKELYTTDARGKAFSDWPINAGVESVRDMDLILNVSAGYPGTKEWVQYAATPLNVPIAGGCTGVQAPLLYPYIPNQLFGLLGAIKGAAEYEAALKAKYPEYGEDSRYTKGIQRMGPQLIAHCLILALILMGNVIMALNRRQAGGGA